MQENEVIPRFPSCRLLNPISPISNKYSNVYFPKSRTSCYTAQFKYRDQDGDLTQRFNRIYRPCPISLSVPRTPGHATCLQQESRRLSSPPTVPLSDFSPPGPTPSLPGHKAPLVLMPRGISVQSLPLQSPVVGSPLNKASLTVSNKGQNTLSFDRPKANSKQVGKAGIPWRPCFLTAGTSRDGLDTARCPNAEASGCAGLEHISEHTVRAFLTALDPENPQRLPGWSCRMGAKPSLGGSLEGAAAGEEAAPGPHQGLCACVKPRQGDAGQGPGCTEEGCAHPTSGETAARLLGCGFESRPNRPQPLGFAGGAPRLPQGLTDSPGPTSVGLLQPFVSWPWSPRARILPHQLGQKPVDTFSNCTWFACFHHPSS